LVFNPVSLKEFAMLDEDLSRHCDACGKPIGGGYIQCPKMQDLLLLDLWIPVARAF
jgi:hypothetical protein